MSAYGHDPTSFEATGETLQLAHPSKEKEKIKPNPSRSSSVNRLEFPKKQKNPNCFRNPSPCRGRGRGFKKKGRGQTLSSCMVSSSLLAKNTWLRDHVAICLNVRLFKKKIVQKLFVQNILKIFIEMLKNRFLKKG